MMMKLNNKKTFLHYLLKNADSLLSVNFFMLATSTCILFIFKDYLESDTLTIAATIVFLFFACLILRFHLNAIEKSKSTKYKFVVIALQHTFFIELFLIAFMLSFICAKRAAETLITRENLLALFDTISLLFNIINIAVLFIRICRSGVKLSDFWIFIFLHKFRKRKK
jgi:hypothetical protein